MTSVRWCIDSGCDVVAHFSCGTLCSGYKPRNGISGCCKFFRKYIVRDSEVSQKITELIDQYENSKKKKTPKLDG